MPTPSHYDAFATDFSSTRQHEWPEFQYAIQRLKKGDRVLDLGCGNGRLRKFLDIQLVPKGHYFGFDISENLLDLARQTNPEDHFFRGNFAERLPFGNDNFDVIVGIASFHHLLTKADQLACLSELHRVLKPHGHLVLTTWKLPQKHFWRNLKQPDFWLSRWKNYLVPFGAKKHPRFYRLVPDTELGRLLVKSGFEVLQSELVRGRNWVVVGRKIL